MRFLINIINRISFKSCKKSKIIVYDKNYNRILDNLIDEDFIVFNIHESRLNVCLFTKSIFEYLLSRPENVSFFEIYFKKYLQTISPNVVISFEDTNFGLLRLSRYFKNIKFILVQNSYRPPRFYGKRTLKKDDIFITYSPLVKFNICSNEVPMKSFKYFNGVDRGDSLKNKVILISQYRQHNNDRMVEVTKEYFSEIDNGHLFLDNPNYFKNQDKFLNFLPDFFKENEKKIFYKSAHREQTSFLKSDESSYFMKFNLPEFKISNEDIFKTTSNDIYICLDSTMIFELISNNKKVIIYPHRKLFVSSSLSPHFEIFRDKFPELFISEDFSDFEIKFNLLDDLSMDEYASKVKLFNSMQKFNLNKYL
jgi:surface carbohydrate biosynthesis protein